MKGQLETPNEVVLVDGNETERGPGRYVVRFREAELYVIRHVVIPPDQSQFILSHSRCMCVHLERCIWLGCFFSALNRVHGLLTCSAPPSVLG